MVLGRGGRASGWQLGAEGRDGTMVAVAAVAGWPS